MVIAIGGAARTGKNLFASLIKERLGTNWVLDSIAYELKSEVKEFLKDSFNLDPFSEKTEEKNQFRPFLVWYANLKRAQNVRYWIDKVDKRVRENENKGTNTILTDLRFAEIKDKDEVYWIKNELGGIIVYIEMYQLINGEKVYTPPANNHEEKNNNIISKMADYRLDWRFAGKNITTLSPYITLFIDWLEWKTNEKIISSNEETASSPTSLLNNQPICRTEN